VDGGIEEEWESYLKQLDRMGLPELMEVYQAGLDRFNANQ
jgi:putative aldouronate transport system substrate-binding protein